MLAALFVIEITDIIFAVDSVPAILAVSNEPYLVFASNAFAILGLRAMYFLLANAKERFHYLSHALGGILIFVGVKMAISHWYHMNTYVSLAIIVTMLVAAIVFSRNAPHAKPHASRLWPRGGRRPSSSAAERRPTGPCRPTPASVGG